MRFLNSPFLLLGLAGSTLAYPSPRSNVKPPKGDLIRANAVKRTFQRSWDNYYKYAFPHDQLHPVSKGYDDERNEWGATVVDALTTAIIMKNTKVVDDILKFIPTVDFTTTKEVNSEISVFETTIRYLGGMLAAYDLLSGPFENVPTDKTNVGSLLKQAKTLGDSLSITFNTTSGVSDGRVFLNPTRRNGGGSSNNLAEAGTLILEWTRLSDLTKDDQYAKLAEKAESYLLNPTGSPQPWPGLVGSDISTADGSFLNSNGGWVGGADSFYEYLIKMYLYDPKSYGEYKDRWVLAADSTIEHLASHPTTAKNLTFLTYYTGQITHPSSQHLASFAGGNFILGGVLLGEDKYTQFGIQLAESYYETYRQTATGIGPEVFQWVDNTLPVGGNNSAPPAGDVDFYNKAGFWPTAGYYIQRPETMESIYYAYRATGDKKYQDFAWDAFKNIRNVTETGTGFAGINDVNQAGGGGFIDQQQSFWLAETLKYLYLIFDEESDVQLQAQGGQNKFVFNTEAHPVHVR